MHVRARLLMTLSLMVALIALPLPATAGDEPEPEVSSGQPGSAEQPNIVLVVMDNFGYGEPGIYGGGEIRGAPTPRIDSIAHEGLQLTNYNVDSECTPTRSALMSGRYSMRTRLRHDGTPRSEWYGLTAWEHTLPEMLSDAGYATGIFGKWHLGEVDGRFPTDQGFDEWWGIPRSSNEAHWPDSNSVPADLELNYQQVMSATRGERPSVLEIYDRARRATIDRESTDRAIEFIRRKAGVGEPFFAYLPYTQTHTPHDPHPDTKGRTGNGNFADILAQTDEYVGDLLDTVDELGLKDDTIFIFTSDNGGYGGIEREGSNGPWRGGIFTTYEGAYRVPFLIRWPGKIPAMRKSNAIVHAMDVYATLAAFVGTEMPTDRVMDSADYSDFMMGKTDEPARESLVLYLGNEIVGAKWRNWKMLLKEMERIGQPLTIRTRPAFYNLYKDPNEREPLRHHYQDSWASGPLNRAVRQHRASLAADPGTPDDAELSDPDYALDP